VLQKLWPSSDSRSSATREINLVCVARGIRGFGDGFVIIILPAYLSAIGFDAVEVGLVATAALLGSAVTTLAMGYLAPRHDLRTFLFAGAIVMAATGLALPQVEHIAFIAAVVFFGTINPSPGDIGMLVPLEQAMLAHGVADHQRTRAFARYSLIGALATAAGSLAAAAPDALVVAGVGRIAAFKAMFWFYAALGLVAAAVYRRLPHARAEDARPAAALGPSRAIVYKLAALFSLDAFAGGFIVQSLLALWLFERFDLSLAAASLFFFWSSVLGAFSFPVAAWLSGRIGLVNTMVFTHVPSSICLIAAAFAPNLAAALALLLVRSALSQMDVPTRTSYVMAVVTPAERTAAASVTAVPRTLTSSISPALAGVMLAGSFTGLPLVMCGVLKIVYDVALLISFRHIRPPEESRRQPVARGDGAVS
jgi:MFS family permease